MRSEYFRWVSVLREEDMGSERHSGKGENTLALGICKFLEPVGSSETYSKYPRARNLRDDRRVGTLRYVMD